METQWVTARGEHAHAVRGCGTGVEQYQRGGRSTAERCRGREGAVSNSTITIVRSRHAHCAWPWAQMPHGPQQFCSPRTKLLYASPYPTQNCGQVGHFSEEGPTFAACLGLRPRQKHLGTPAAWAAGRPSLQRLKGCAARSARERGGPQRGKQGRPA